MRIPLALLVLLSILGVAHAQINPAVLREWRGQKYSMFIHFGIYSQLGGVWEGKPVARGLSEQIQAHAGIYSDVYADVARQFNPVKWNPDSVALLAREAGMRSIVITSKHHDGFAMFNSAFTNFDVVDATPYQRDFIKELANACKRHGLKFGLYFSLIDWHYPQASPISSHNSDYITPEHHEFNKNQITELLTNYETISELWFDMGSMSKEQSKEMRELVHRLQPDCMIGSRIGNDMGDFTVMGDNQEPDYVIGVPWQSPASFFDETWGYRSWQRRTDVDEKTSEKLTSLIRVASRGGNFLLNIGPRGDGSVVEYEKDVLRKIGEWLRKNGEAIYDTDADPFHVSFPWGSVTSRLNTIYLHVLRNPERGHIELPGLKGKVARAFVLAAGITCKTEKTNAGITIQLPAGLDASKEFKVIVLEFAGSYTVAPMNILPAGKEKIVINTQNAFKYYSNSGIDYNSRFTSTIKEAWTLLPQVSSKRAVELVYSEEESGKIIELDLNGSTQIITLDEGEKVVLENDVPSLKPGTIYSQGPFESGVEDVQGDLRAVDAKSPWPDSGGKPWLAHPEWKPGNDCRLPAGHLSAYYLLQEVESPQAMQVLVRIKSGDGILVFVNGTKRLVQNNPLKREFMSHVLLLDLKEGRNQIVVKVFNSFKTQTPFSIDYSIPQVLYRKQLPEIALEKGKYFPVEWKLHHPENPHMDMGTSNLALELK